MVTYVIGMADLVGVVIDVGCVGIGAVRIGGVLDPAVGGGVAGGTPIVPIVLSQQGRWIGPPVLRQLLSRHVDGCGSSRVVSNLESHLHVVRGASTSGLSVQVVSRRCRDEVIVVAGLELHPARGGGERAEGDGEVHQLLRLVTDCDDARGRRGDATRLVLFFGDGIDNVTLCVGVAQLVIGADYVHLVVLPRLVAPVNVNDVVRVVYSENRIGSVPMDKVGLTHR